MDVLVDLLDRSDSPALFVALQRVEQWQKYERGIMAAMDVGRLRVKSHFLTGKKCDDKKHLTCGADSPAACNELAAKVYRFMGEMKKEAANVNKRRSVASNGVDMFLQQQAQKLASELRCQYPQFKWSVILEGKVSVYECRLGQTDVPDLCKDLWIQTHGKLPQPAQPGGVARWFKVREISTYRPDRI